MPTRETWWFPFQMIRVIDGDTFSAILDLGHRTYLKRAVRLLGVNTPELNDTDQAKRLLAQSAKSFVALWFASHPHGTSSEWPFSLRSEKPDSFGRFLAHVECCEGHSLSQSLIDDGYGDPA